MLASNSCLLLLTLVFGGVQFFNHLSVLGSAIFYTCFMLKQRSGMLNCFYLLLLLLIKKNKSDSASGY